MFNTATNFNQPIGSWNLSSLVTANTMFYGTGISFQAGKSNYCAAGAERAALVASRGWTIARNVKTCPSAEVSIAAPTKLRNQPIADTTITIMSGLNGLTVDVADIIVAPTATATVTDFICTQTSAIRVDCILTVDSPDDLLKSIVIHATNSDGQTGSATEGGYVVDRTPPEIRSISIDTDAGIHTPIVTFTADDNVGVARFDVIYTPYNGGAGVGVPVMITGSASPLSLILDLDEVTLTNVHTITIRAFDTAGNMSEDIIKFPPIVNFTAPTVVSNATINNATVAISSPAGNNIDNITIGGPTGATLGACTGSNGGTSAPFVQPVTCQINNIASSGTVQIRAQDAVNGATGQNSQSFVVDTTGNVRLAGASTLGGTQSVRYRAPSTPGAPDAGAVLRGVSSPSCSLVCLSS